jgi:hypothetical protein
MKRANKDEKSTEWVEGRGWTKGDTRETAVLRPQTRNISLGGLSLDSALPLKPSMCWSYKSTLGRKMGATGEVVSAERVQREKKGINSVGVEIFDIPAETRKQLMEFLTDHLPEPDSKDQV